MKLLTTTALGAAIFCASSMAAAQQPAVTAAPSPVAATQAVAGRAMPASTMLSVTPAADMSSSSLRVGDQVQFHTVGDVSESGVVVIPRGSPVAGRITWKTGRAIGGKSGKFDVTFETVTVGGREYRLRGVHRQEGRGNTTGALLGSIWISGRSANMRPGDLASAFTTDAIPY